MSDKKRSLSNRDEEDHEHESSKRRIVDLLIEMLEVADYVVLNKSDRLSEERRKQLHQLVTSLNPAATVVACEFGKVPLETVLGAPKGPWACLADDEEEIKRAVKAARRTSRPSHSKRAAPEDAASSVFGALAAPSLPANRAGREEEGPRGNSMGGGDGLSRAANGVRGQQTSVQERFGIGNFVYSRRRPFHPQRLMDAIKHLPVEVDMDGHVVADWEIPAMFLGRGAGSANKSPKQDEEDGSRIMHSVLRSKGFVWLANAPQTMHYWSHAGHFFALEALGPWWGATDAREWPHTLDEVQRILDDWSPPPSLLLPLPVSLLYTHSLPTRYHDDVTTGDRRQEVVFIGVDMDQDAIEEVMDRCLLSDKEMQLYQQHVSRNRVQPAGPTAASTVKANELMRPPPPRAPAALAQK